MRAEAKGISALYRLREEWSFPPAFTRSTATLVAFALTAFLAWLKCGRDIAPIRSAFLIARYILKKRGLYRVVLSNKAEAQWTRTDREKAE